MGVGVVGLAENKATQPSLAGAWAELGKNILSWMDVGYTKFEQAS